MEENKNIEISETNWGKEQILLLTKNITLISHLKKKKKTIPKYIDFYKTFNKYNLSLFKTIRKKF